MTMYRAFVAAGAAYDSWNLSFLHYVTLHHIQLVGHTRDIFIATESVPQTNRMQPCICQMNRVYCALESVVCLCYGAIEIVVVIIIISVCIMTDCVHSTDKVIYATDVKHQLPWLCPRQLPVALVSSFLFHHSYSCFQQSRHPHCPPLAPSFSFHLWR